MFENIKEAVVTIKGKKVRYCDTLLQRISPCNSGWGQEDDTGTRCCFDKPMEEYCHNIVDVRDLQCPYCGSHVATR